MSFFDKVYTKLFGDDADHKPVEDHRLLKRSERFTREFSAWLETERLDEIRTQVRTSITLKQRDLSQEPFVHLLVSNNSHGLAIDHSGFFEIHEFSYLLDWSAATILSSFNYKLSNADVRIVEKKDKVITTERRYLKPKTVFETPIDQQFGNLLIESVIEGNNPVKLKLQANSYSDRNYQAPRPFQDLLNHLFEDQI